MKRPLLSIVIPTYNSANLVLRCLRSLESQTADTSDFEVIVVNDGSTDTTSEILQEFVRHSTLTLQSINLSRCGPAIARNQGVLKTKADWVAFLDADVVANESWVERALTLISRYPEMGGFEGCTQISEQEKITPFTHQTSNLHGGRYPTCNLILRKSLCSFYPGYKIPFREDTDLAFSIQESGYEIRFDSRLEAFHPPLSACYTRPIHLAMRYYYDGLLARRFPVRYNNDVDVHYLLGIRLPHLRRKVYSVFVLSQLTWILCALLHTPELLLSVILATHLFAYGCVIAVHLKFSDISQIRIRDFIILSGMAYVIPWIMLIQRWRGIIAFRQDPQFSQNHIPSTPRPALTRTDSKVIPFYSPQTVHAHKLSSKARVDRVGE